jgi:hypothetical protein
MFSPMQDARGVPASDQEPAGGAAAAVPRATGQL